MHVRLLVLFALLLGCDNKTSGGAPTATASATASAKPTATAEAPPPPEALDVETLKKALKCGGKGAGPCEVLAEIHDCEAFDPVTSGGDGRWLGEAYITKKGAFTEDFVVVRSRRVPSTDVGPGQLLAKMAVDRIADTYPEERDHAPKAIRAFERGDVPPPTNQAIRYTKERSDWAESYTMKAAGNQVYAALHGGAYFCKISKQRLAMVELAQDRDHPADGTYAILWPVSW
jgi:hypothetical protein